MNKNIDPGVLGAVIRELRELRGYTQRQIAAYLNVTENYLSLLENGKRGIAQPLLNNLAEVLDVPANWIVFLGTSCREDDDDKRGQLTAKFQGILRKTIVADQSEKAKVLSSLEGSSWRDGKPKHPLEPRSNGRKSTC